MVFPLSVKNPYADTCIGQGMRVQFSQKISDPRVSVIEGTFDSTHIPDGWADLVIVGTGRKE